MPMDQYGKLYQQILIPLLFFIIYLVLIYRYNIYNNIVDKTVAIGLILYYSILDIRYGLVACFLLIIYFNTIPRPVTKSLNFLENFDLMNVFSPSTMSQSVDKEFPTEIVEYKNNNNSDDDVIPKIIWLYWHDDIQSAPKIVQYCVNLIHKLNKNYKINVLNQNNKNKFVKDPAVLKHLNNPRLKENYKSDLLRMYLISTYGGIYLDSSIVLFEPLDWIYNLPNYDLIMYKANVHTTNNNKPVLEAWFIAAKPNNILIKETVNMLTDIFDNNMQNKFNILKNDKTVDYQNFKNHDIYHVVYFCLVYIQHKFNITNNNHFIDCNPNIFPFNVLYGNNHTLDKLYNAPISEKTFNIYKSKHMLKLASYNRKYIEQNKLKPKLNSFMDRLEKYIYIQYG